LHPSIVIPQPLTTAKPQPCVENGVVRPIADPLAFGKITLDEAAKKLIEGAKRAVRQTS
jgi:hypothetical protein